MFFSIAKRGAHKPAYLKTPDYTLFQKLNAASGGNIRIACVAAELEESLDFIRQVKGDALVSLAHSNADYDTALKAFSEGATHVTHLYNGMSPFLHRAPGVVGAAMDSPDVNVEVISDGRHLHECTVRGAFRLFGAERIILISDNTSYCGLPNGEYGEGNEKVIVRDGWILKEQGTLSGSGQSLFDDVRSAISFGIPMEDAVRCATFNPAKAIGVLERVGTIENGKNADFIICDDQLNIQSVYIQGNRVV